MSDPARISEITNKITEIVTTTSGSPPPPNTVPNASNVSASVNGSFGFAVHRQPREEIMNQEEEGEGNREIVSETITPCNRPSTSSEPTRNRRFIIIDRHNMANSSIFNDPAIQLLTKVLFCPGEADPDDILKVQNSLLTREQVEMFKKAQAAKNSTKNSSPADKRN